MLLGTKQDSNVSTLGGTAVAGRGEVIGARANISLPNLKEFYHSISLGFDYKHFDENVIFGTSEITAPITYYPINAAYSATWAGKNAVTELNAGVYFHFRGAGPNQDDFDAKRFKADRNYLYFRGDLSHTHDLPFGFEVFGKVQGQLADQPLVNSEQFSGGGLSTVRGYLESEVLGDNAVVGSVELRGPSLSTWLGKRVDEWRFYLFCDAAWLTLNEPLPEQDSSFDLASVGLGTRIRLLEHFDGSIDAGLPLLGQSRTGARDLLLTFRLSAEF
jgi:hemolysin activation/secretion protein